MSRIILVGLVLSGLCPFARAEPPAATRANEAGADRKAIDRLSDELRTAIRGSRINVIPNGADGVILAGFVPDAKDKAAAQVTARRAGYEVVDALRLEDTRQIHLDVVVVQVKEGEVLSLDSCKARYAKRFGREPVPSAPKRRESPIVGILPAWLKKAIVNEPPAEKLSQQHLDGILDQQQHEPFVTFLQAQENLGQAKILCQPRLITPSGRSASFLVGLQAVPVPVGLGSVGIQFEESGPRLNCLPALLRDGRIRLDCEVEDNTEQLAIAGTTVGGFTLQHKQMVDLRPGESLVIGGKGFIILVTPRQLVPREDAPSLSSD